MRLRGTFGLLGVLVALLTGLALLPAAAVAYEPGVPPWLQEVLEHPPGLPSPPLPEAPEASAPPLPDTAIDAVRLGPARRSVTISFHADVSATAFGCKLDKGAFAACGSPVTYSTLRPGRHWFAVAAVSAAGSVDPSPAGKFFRIPSPKAKAKPGAQRH